MPSFPNKNICKSSCFVLYREENGAANMRNWIKTALFITSFSPALINVSIARWLNHGFSSDVIYYAAVGFVGSFLSLCVIKLIKKLGEVINFTAKKIESNDTLMLGVVATYFFPFFGRASEITVGVVAAITLLGCIVLWITSAIFPHPLLRLFGFRFYKVEASNGVVYTLITERELFDPKDVQKVKKISNTMLMEIK